MTSSSPHRTVVFSGPSGSGKSTLVKKLMAEFKDAFAFSISHTTRNPRPGETNGKEYHFVTREAMLSAIKNNEFIEHAEFSGNIYGTSTKSVEDVQQTGRICILDVDMQGVKSIKDTKLDPRYIFVQPPSLDILEQRLRGRGTEAEDAIQKRLTIATSEMKYAEEKGSYDHYIVNDDLNVAYEKLKEILIQDVHEVLNDRHKSH